MRRVLILLALLAALAVPAAAQFSLLGIKNSLFQFALDQISVPGELELNAEGVEESKDGATEIVGLTVSDRDGVWLRIERLSIRWNARRIVSGELEIERLAAIGVDVLRAPAAEAVDVEVRDDSVLAETDDDPFDWPRSPVPVNVAELAAERVTIAPGVVAAQGLAFDAVGAFADEGDEQSARMNVTRSDGVSGRIVFDYVRDFAGDRLDLRLEADEAAGGITAELAGLPPESASALTLIGAGPLTDWALDFDAASDNVFSATGDARIDAADRIAATANFSLTPGSALDPALALALSPRAELVVDLAEDAAGVVVIRQGALTARDLTLAAEGAFNRTTLVSDFAVALEARRGLADLVDGLVFQRVGFEGAVIGPPDDLTLTGLFELNGLETAPADIGAASFEAVVRVADGAVSASATGAAEALRLDRLTPDLIGPATLTLNALYHGDRVELSSLRLSSRPLLVSASGAVDIAAATATGRYDVETTDVAPFAAAYDLDATGGLNAEGALSGPFAALRLAGSAAATGLSFDGEPFGEAQLSHDATFGETPEGTASLRADGSRFGAVAFDGGFLLDGERLTLRDMVATGLGARVDGAATVDLGAALVDGDVGIDAPDLTPISAAAGQDVAGGASGALRLSASGGTQDVTLDLELRDFAAAGAMLTSGELTGDVADAFGAPAVDIALSFINAGFESADGPSARIGSGAATAAGPLDDLSLTATLSDIEAAGATVRAARGEARVRGGAETPEGSVTATLTDIAFDDARVGSADLSAEGSLSELALDATLNDIAAVGATIRRARAEALVRNAADAPEGSVTATVTDVALHGARVASANLSAEGSLSDLSLNAAINGIAAGDAAVRRVTGEARLGALDSADPKIDGRLAAVGLAAGPATLTDARLTAAGRLSALTLKLTASGELDTGDALSLDIAGRADLAGPPAARISRAAASAGEIGVRLRAPLTITTSGGGTGFSGLDLIVAGAALTGDAALYADGLTGDLALDVDDLAPIAALAGAPLDAGAASAAARFDTRPGSARAAASLDARGLRFADVVADVGALDLDVDLDWNGRSAAIVAAISGPFGDPVRARAAIPLRPGAGVLPTSPPGEALDGAIDWRGEIGDFWALVPAPGHNLAGEAKVALTLGGDLNAPEIGGDVAVTDGRYENLDIGTILVDLTAASRIAPGGAFVVDIAAEDGANGPVSITAAVDDGRLDAKLSAQAATLVRRDDVTASVSLDIVAAGPLAAPDIAGSVVIERAEVRLVDASPPGVADLGPVRIKGEDPPEPEPDIGEEIDLDISVTGPQGIFVRGRGLDSEWAVDLKVSGVAADPRVTGVIEKRRGVLTFLGAALDLDQGVIRFTGSKGIDPTLNIQLIRENDGVRGGIAVTGAAKAPDISFVSRPALPEEEVLPRILFGRSRQSLSPSEAVSLGIGVATLLDGGGGSVDQVRGAVGLDVLRCREYSMPEPPGS